MSNRGASIWHLSKILTINFLFFSQSFYTFCEPNGQNKSITVWYTLFCSPHVPSPKLANLLLLHLCEKYKKGLSVKFDFWFRLRNSDSDLEWCHNGFGGLVVSRLASGTQVCGFKPGRSHWIFTDVKILSMPSSGGEVKESVPCPSFAACKRT